MILGLRTVIYPAPDLAAAKDWYSKVLGQEPYFDEPFYVGFSVGGFELGLLPNAQPGTVGPQPLWGVANIESAYARLLELGASMLEPVAEVGEGIKVAAVNTPSAIAWESSKILTSIRASFGDAANSSRSGTLASITTYFL